MFEWVHYQFPSRVFFERDATHKIGTLARDIGTRVLLIAVRDELHNPDELAIIKTSLEKYTTGCIVYDDMASMPGNEDLDTAAHFAKQCKADVVLGFGSRLSFSAAKAISLLANNQTFAGDLAEASFPLKKPPLPVITVPASPAMGEESSPLFFVNRPASQSTFLGHDIRLFPALIFVDPNVTTGLQAADFTRAGIATLAASIEAILSKRANDISNSIALRSIELVTRNLVNVVQEPNNTGARNNICMASVLSGMAHSNSRLGLCYSLALAASLNTTIDFFTAMSILLPHIMEYNLTTSAGKYVQIARALDEDIRDITVIEAAIKAVEGVRKLYIELKVPQRLSDFEIAKGDLPGIAEKAMQMPLTRNTPRELDRNEIETILIAAY